MGQMSRRGFLGRSTALAVSAMMPIPKAMALVAQDTPALRWFAVGDDEFLWPYLSTSMEGAIRQHAEENGYTVGDECPDCGEMSCTDHNADLSAPLPWLEDYSFAFDSRLPVDREPSLAEWIKAGCNVPCEACDYGEPTECRMFQGQALCEECLQEARTERLDRMVGTQPGTPTNQPRWLWHGEPARHA
ncbi:hypothetical protein [Salipiger sp. PrR003]|uniref:hypothetical protein n=1 Tax=Salipiger sp. PrR003 TaxID=2706776 RepID=UPI0013DC0F0C|nr:hypothetical protein [Salipiger sp. PrR003]NDV53857.1 hypothetical protein [Salipiger sp. PrR003]